MLKPRAAGAGWPSFFALRKRRWRKYEIAVSGIESRVLNVCAARKGKKIMGIQLITCDAVFAPAVEALRWLAGVRSSKNVLKLDGPSLFVKE